ncbi:MAG: RidA family protein [Bacteroidota bacterium]
MKNTILFILVCLIALPILSQTPEENIEKFGIELPEVKKPGGIYVNWRKAGNMLYIAGMSCRCELKGKIGKDLSLEQGQEAARLTAINILAIIKQATGDLSKVKQFVRVEGMVSSATDFYDQPKVINAFSGLMRDVFGEKGMHTRAAIGQAVLPGNTPVEIVVTLELVDEG